VLLTDLDPARAALELSAWADSYQRGVLKRGFGSPRTDDGERWAAQVSPAGLQQLSQRDITDLGPLIGSGSSHQAAVTSERVLLCAGRRVVRAWPLADLYDLRALDDVTGVVMLPYEPNPDYDDRFDALLSAPVPTGGGLAVLLPHQRRREVHLDWLKFEGAFAGRRDQLDSWVQRLPDRISQVLARAKAGS
jgi:hypothetical protein